MSQHSLNIANEAGAAFRADVNAGLQALASQSSGSSAPGTTYAYQRWADTTNGVIKRRNAANSGWVVDGTLAETYVVARSSNTILAMADHGKWFRATSGFTQTLTAAATLGDGWYVGYRVESGATLVIDPNGTENIDGATTKSIVGPASGVIFCDATGFYTYGFAPATTYHACDGRLTLASATPIVTTNQSAKTTVYFTPFRGNRIELYSSGSWSNISFAETSVAVPATTNTPFDIFAYNNSGTLALETVNWTNDTARATALTTQDGIYCKNGDTTRRYLGTGRTTGVSGQTQTTFGAIDTAPLWLLWNYYNRVDVDLLCGDSTNTWTYTTATWRQANASAVNQVGFITGVAEDPVSARVLAFANNAGAAGVVVAAGVGVDSTSANSAGLIGGRVNSSAGIGDQTSPILAEYTGVLAAGYHYLAWLEISTAAGTTTWWGDNGSTFVQAGMKARIKA